MKFTTHTKQEVNLEEIKPKDTLIAKFSFKNSSKTIFTGKIILALMDADKDSVKYILKENLLTNINSDSVIAPYSISGIIPKKIKTGDYTIDILARENENEEWVSLNYSGGGSGGGSIFGKVYRIIGEYPLSIEELFSKKDGLIIYPNPVTDIIKINTTSKIESVTIYDYSGKRIKRINIIPQNEIKVQDLPSGNYILTIKNQQGTITKKFIKK